jgi:GWxTD domain-containing protein
MRDLKHRWLLWGILAGLAFLSACRLYNLEKKLDPSDADFLSKVRYIITSEERKIFLELPDFDKPKFIEDFWKRRDPDPATEENEFKTEYFKRINLATQYFIGEGTPGWLTDRGRIYVLYGPPTEKTTRPMSGDVYSRCGEVWLYDIYPVVFVDQTCTGTFKLATFDLSMLKDINSMFGMTQADTRKTSSQEKKTFDFNADLKITAREPQRLEGMVVLELLYERIWYTSQGKKMWTTLETVLELRDAKNELIWSQKLSSELSLSEAELEDKSGKSYKIEVPLLVQDETKIAKLGQGKSLLQITMTNKTGGETVKKVLEFK